MLHYAAENGVSLAMVELLMRQLGDEAPGYCKSKSCNGLTPLDTAICLGHHHVVAAFCQLLQRSTMIALLQILDPFVQTALEQRVGWFKELMFHNQRQQDILDNANIGHTMSIRTTCTMVFLENLYKHQLGTWLSMPYLPPHRVPSLCDIAGVMNYIKQAFATREVIGFQGLAPIYSRYESEEFCRKSFFGACSRGLNLVVEPLVGLDVLGEDDLIEGAVTALVFGQLEITAFLVLSSVRILEGVRVKVEEEEEVSLSQLVWLVLFGGREEIVRQFVAPCGHCSRMSLADVWLTHQFGRHQAKLLRSRLGEEDCWEESIPLPLTAKPRSECLELRVNWYSFRDCLSSSSSSSSYDPEIPLCLEAFVISSVLGQLHPHSRSASLHLTDLFPGDASSLQSLSLSCVRLPNLPYAHSDGYTASLVVAYSSEMQQFFLPRPPKDDSPSKSPSPSSTGPLFTISVAEQLKTLANRLHRWYRHFRKGCHFTVTFSDGFFNLSLEACAALAPCVAMAIDDVQDVLKLTSRHMVLYAEAGRVPYWFQEVYWCLAHRLIPTCLFSDVKLQFRLGYEDVHVVDQEVKVWLEEEDRCVLHIELTVLEGETPLSYSVPSHAALLQELAHCLLEAEVEVLKVRTWRFFSNWWRRVENGGSGEVFVSLEDRERIVTPLLEVASERVFVLKMFSLFEKALVSLATQQERFRELTDCSSSQTYCRPLEVTLSLSQGRSYLDHSQLNLVLSFWDIVRGTLSHSLDLLQSMLQAEGITLSSLSHFPCAASSFVDLGLSPGLLYPVWDRKQDIVIQLQSITKNSVCGKELKEMIRVDLSYRHHPSHPWSSSGQSATVSVGEKKPLAKLSWQVQPTSELAQLRVSISICGHPLKDSPLYFLDVIDRPGLLASGHAEAYVGYPISVVVGHCGGRCTWWTRTKVVEEEEEASSEKLLHYLEAMKVVKGCRWQVPHSEKGVALFVGTDKGIDSKACITCRYSFRARVSPMSHSLSLLSFWYGRTLPFHVAAFCIRCHCMLKMYWREVPTCLPRLCRFRPGLVLSAELSTITSKCPTKIPEFSLRRYKGQCHCR